MWENSFRLAEEPLPVVVEILGRSLRLKSSIPGERLKEIAQEVDARLRQLQQAFPAAPLAEVAILAALNLACEVMERQEEYSRLQKDIQQRFSRLIHKLEDQDI